jgi:hypothetical protein
MKLPFIASLTRLVSNPDPDRPEIVGPTTIRMFGVGSSTDSNLEYVITGIDRFGKKHILESTIVY